MTNIKIIQNNSVPKWIITHLDEVFPDALPRNTNISISQLSWLQGQRVVVDYLKSLNEDEEE